ncbi:MAG: hypothetical protein CMM01_18445 [Rhodopirellula sp.]|nr:hypothetical protein [Rhodopirellula sp.]
MFDDQSTLPREWVLRGIHFGRFRGRFGRMLWGRMEWYRITRRVCALLLVCCSLLSMDVLIAQENVTPNGGTGQPEENAADDSTFSWPRKTQQDALVVFLGDSITHQGLYTQYLENFFYTRYSNLGIRFRNAGVAGDSVSDALARFDNDVASHHPDYVTVLFGMNDGQYEDFDASIFAEYQAHMKRLLDRIESVGAKPIVLSPTMFDHEVTRLRQDDPTWRFREKNFSNSYNALMSLFGAWSWDESRRRGNEFVNLWAPLNSYTDLGRRQNPHFTLIGDAIHPQASGQVVMAYEILMQLGVERRFCASRVVTNTSQTIGNRVVGNRVLGNEGSLNRGAKWTAGKGIRDLQVTDQGRSIKFKHDEVALPWVIPAQHSTVKLRWDLPSDGNKGFEMTHAGHRLSADRIKIAGLPAGQYEVRVDGKLIGSWSHVTLGTKVELQELQKTPQYQQSLAVAELNRRRYDEFVRPVRDRMASLKGIKRRFAADSDEYKRRSAPLLKTIQELQAGADQMDREIRMLARPQCRQWDIRRVDSKTK